VGEQYRSLMGGLFQSKKAAIIGGIVLIVLIVAFGVGGLYFAKKDQQSSVPPAKGITGVLNVNGVIPQGSTITLLQRETQGTAPFVPFEQNITPTDLNTWQFINGKPGKSYEIQASIVQNGKVVYLSDPIFVTAPAINQPIALDVSVPNPTGPANATISGSVGIDGYIPPGATLTLQGRKVGTQKFTDVTKGIAAKDEQFLSYTTAIAGQEYEVKALLFDASGNLIGESAMLTLVAPAANEELNVNSVAQPPVTPTAIPTITPTPSPTLTPTPTFIVTQVTSILTATPTSTPTPTNTPGPTNTPAPTPVPPSISGTIQFNGQAPSNTRIVIFQRVSGSQNYQVAVDNITPQNGTNWQWTGAQAGQLYQMVAILKQRQSNGTDIDMADSPTLSIAAPAANEVFTINSGYSLSAPTGAISWSCGNYNSSSQTWTPILAFGNMQNAQTYWFQIGITNGGAELTNLAQNATQNPTQSFTQQFQNGVTYYARYAYSTVSNVTLNDPSFSPFSATTQVHCP